MQYRYHEWNDPILSKRTAEAIACASLTGLKMGCDKVDLQRSGDQWTIAYSTNQLPNNSINDWLHVDSNRQLEVQPLIAFITPDGVLTAESEPLSFVKNTTSTDSVYMLVATHRYTELPGTDDAQGGTSTSYQLLNLDENVRLAGGWDNFKSTYINGSTHPIGLIPNDNDSKPFNSVVLCVTRIRRATFDSYENYPLINNKVPVIEDFTTFYRDSAYQQVVDAVAETIRVDNRVSAMDLRLTTLQNFLKVNRVSSNVTQFNDEAGLMITHTVIVTRINDFCFGTLSLRFDAIGSAGPSNNNISMVDIASDVNNWFWPNNPIIPTDTQMAQRVSLMYANGFVGTVTIGTRLGTVDTRVDRVVSSLDLDALKTQILASTGQPWSSLVNRSINIPFNYMTNLN